MRNPSKRKEADHKKTTVDFSLEAPRGIKPESVHFPKQPKKNQTHEGGLQAGGVVYMQKKCRISVGRRKNGIQFPIVESLYRTK